jgi:acetyltransferase
VGALFAPKSIVVIGASSDPERFGGKIIPSLLRQGYKGKIYPINPKRTELNGLQCYPDLGSVPGQVDCVIFCLAASHIRSVLKDCEAKGAKLLVISSAGFAESGTPEGKALQDELIAYTRKSGIRVLGPNCFGFTNLGDRICASAAAALDWPDVPAGRIGVVTQSGGLGLATILVLALEEGISFSHIVSTGNEADLDTIDIGRFYVEDPNTDVIAMTVEAVRDTDAFMELVRMAGEAHKPMVLLKSGRTDLGKTMAASHTGALAGSAAVFDAVCTQYGIVCARDVDDFYQIAAMFAKLRSTGKLGRFSNPGAQCASLSLSGGHIGLLADHASQEGLKFPPFAAETNKLIVKELGFEGHFQNPLDTTARVIGDDGFWGRCVSVLLSDPGITTVLPIITVARTYDPAIHDFIRLTKENEKIIVVIWPGCSFIGDGKRILRESNVPMFRTSARAAMAIRALDRYCNVWNSAPQESRTVSSNPGAAPARALLERARAGGKTSLTERESKDILSHLGFPTTRETVVRTAEEAVAAAKAIGYPVALKGEHPDILHKSDAGLVLLNINSDAAVKTAFQQIVERMEKAAPGVVQGRVLVQEMVPAGTELILGITFDPEFGSVVLLGLGGIFVEIMKDVVMRLPPFNHEEARRMIEELRGVRLLKGARGRRSVNLDHLADLLVRLGDFAVANKDIIREVDINPLIAVDNEKGDLRIVDALMLLHK